MVPDVTKTAEYFRDVLWVPELDAFFEELQTRGVYVVQGIVKRVYGRREFFVRDCNGYKIILWD